MRMVEKFKKWWHTESEKLAPMNFGSRVEYILFYYRFWIGGLILLLCFGLYVGDAIYQSRREIMLQGFFTNDDYGLFNAGDIWKDYTSSITLQKDQRVVFDDVLYIDLKGGATDYTAASDGKIIAYFATGELDFVVTSLPVFEHYAVNVPMVDFNQLLPPDLLDKLAPNSLIYFTNAEGKTAAWGLDMGESRFVRDSQIEEADGHYVMFVPHNVPNKDQLIDFIRYCFS